MYGLITTSGSAPLASLGAASLIHVNGHKVVLFRTRMCDGFGYSPIDKLIRAFSVPRWREEWQ